MQLLSPLAYDMLMFTFVQRLAADSRNKLKEDGVNIADWLQAGQAPTLYPTRPTAARAAHLPAEPPSRRQHCRLAAGGAPPPPAPQGPLPSPPYGAQVCPVCAGACLAGAPAVQQRPAAGRAAAPRRNAGVQESGRHPRTGHVLSAFPFLSWYGDLTRARVRAGRAWQTLWPRRARRTPSWTCTRCAATCSTGSRRTRASTSWSCMSCSLCSRRAAAASTPKPPGRPASELCSGCDRRAGERVCQYTLLLWMRAHPAA